MCRHEWPDLEKGGEELVVDEMVRGGGSQEFNMQRSWHVGAALLAPFSLTSAKPAPTALAGTAGQPGEGTMKQEVCKSIVLYAISEGKGNGHGSDE